MNEKSKFYKDQKQINNLSKDGHDSEWPQERENLEDLLSNLKKYGFEKRDGFLFPRDAERPCNHTSGGKRERCAGVLKETEDQMTVKETEERICRCLFYTNNGSSNNPCDRCLFRSVYQKKNVGSIYIKNYQVPAIYDMSGLGNIDWVLSDGNVTYAVEVKPADSTETISRMLAEILTYTVDRDGEFVPGICFFERTFDGKADSVQYKDYQKNEALVTEICDLTGTHIFVIKPAGTTFTIEKLYIPQSD